MRGLYREYHQGTFALVSRQNASSGESSTSFARYRTFIWFIFGNSFSYTNGNYCNMSTRVGDNVGYTEDSYFTEDYFDTCCDSRLWDIGSIYDNLHAEERLNEVWEQGEKSDFGWVARLTGQTCLGPTTRSLTQTMKTIASQKAYKSKKNTRQIFWES